MKTKLTTVFLIIFCISLNAFSQYGTEKVPGTDKFTIHSKILNEDRLMLIALPDGYSSENNSSPVLYLLDGNTHFRHASSATSYLARQGLAPGMIVVAITNVDRNRDFTPVHNEDMPTTGGAEKFHDFIEKELIPYVDKNYNTSKFNILMGHSFGGTFVGYSLLDRPNVFEAYIAVSPYLQFQDNYIVNQAKLKLKAKYKSPKSFYMTVGDEKGYFEALDEFSSLIQEKSDKAIRFQYVQMPGENHGSTPYLSLFSGLRFTFSDWMLSRAVFEQGLAAVDDHYKQVSKKYNFKVEASENTINMLGYNLLNADDAEKAIEVFKENVKRFPKSANVYDSLGEAYEKDDKVELARENYQTAVEIGKKENHQFLELFKVNLARVQ